MTDYLAIQKTITELCPRVEISNLHQEDEAAFLEMTHNSKDILAPWVFPPENPEAFNELIDRNKQSNFETIVVRPKDEFKIVGIYNLSQIFYHNFQNTILGCYTNIDFHGQGYMREGLLQTIAYAFFKLKLHRIEANIICENSRSLNFFKGFGFRHEGMSPNYLFVNGTWRDHEKFAVTIEDWDKLLNDYKVRKHNRNK